MPENAQIQTFSVSNPTKSGSDFAYDALVRMELRTDIWAAALLRRAQINGASAVIARKGDADAGAVLVKVSTLDGRARLYAPARDGAGERIWLDLSNGPLGDLEGDIEAVCRKRADGDPDLWVIDIEDRHGRHFLTEPIAP